MPTGKEVIAQLFEKFVALEGEARCLSNQDFHHHAFDDSF